MQRADIILGEEYGLRESRQRGGPLQRVWILQHVRGNKWKAEWVEPNPGLVDYIDGRMLLVPWREHEAFIADERSDRCLREDNAANGYEEESTLAYALSTVFDAAGDQVRVYRGELSGPPSALARVRSRAGGNATGRAALEYVDRHDIVHLPFADAVALAKAFCEAEADTVIVYIELSQRPPIAADLFAKFRAADVLVLQWCHAGPSALLRRENERLRQLALEAAEALQSAGQTDAARDLRQEVDGDAASSAPPNAPASSGSPTTAKPSTWMWRGRVRRE